MIETADTLSAKNGYLVGPEVAMLRSLAARTPGDAPTIINIGVGTGASALALLEGNPRAQRQWPRERENVRRQTRDGACGLR